MLNWNTLHFNPVAVGSVYITQTNKQSKCKLQKSTKYELLRRQLQNDN